MFGLMTVSQCKFSAAEREQRRFFYCGTCKTLGSLYGQKSRLLLNNDLVFFAELLTATSQQKHGYGCEFNFVADNFVAGGTERLAMSAFSSFNCFDMPSSLKPDESLPLILQLAADLHIVLAALNIKDKVQDSQHKTIWRSVETLFSPSMALASNRLEQRGFPLLHYIELSAKQTNVERTLNDESCTFLSHELIENSADTTARITESVFYQAGKAFDLSDKKCEILKQFGASFGNLTYCLDALDDLEKDKKAGDFNPIICLTNRKNKGEHAAVKALKQFIYRSYRTAANCLRKLELQNEQEHEFIERLSQNLRRKLNKGTCAACKHSHFHLQSDAKKPLRQRLATIWQSRRQEVDEELRRLLGDSKFRIGLSYIMLWITLYCFPTLSKQASSESECLTIPFNLIAWGTLLQEIRNFMRSTITQPATVTLKSERSSQSSTQNHSITTQHSARHSQGNFPSESEPDRERKPARPYADPNEEESPEITQGDDETRQSPAQRKRRINRLREKNSSQEVRPCFCDTSCCDCIDCCDCACDTDCCSCCSSEANCCTTEVNCCASDAHHCCSACTICESCNSCEACACGECCGSGGDCGACCDGCGSCGDCASGCDGCSGCHCNC